MVPVLASPEDRRSLLRRYGLPNAAPTAGEIAERGALAWFTSARVLFVDDDRDGAPVTWWIDVQRVCRRCRERKT